MKRTGVYRRVALLWAVVFAAVGLAFALAPARVAAMIEAVARPARLSGAIDAGGKLWWVLAVSLMAVLTVLALASAYRPEDRTAFRTLLLSKLVSTLGFAALVVQDGSIWCICATADGFVATTLYVADRADSRAARSSVIVS